LYTRDHIMPFGLLRESRKAAKRAQIIVVSKCPHDLTIEQKATLIDDIKPNAAQTIYFSSIEYTKLYPLSHTSVSYDENTEILLVCGIANPAPLIEKLSKEFKKIYPLTFKDHHYFTFDDAEEIKDAFHNIAFNNKMIITTEKDASRLMLLQEKLSAYELPIYIQSIGIDFLFGEGKAFNEEIVKFIHSMIPPIEPKIDVENEEEKTVYDV
jgi:tetraacyldisaccharide 4'-kinase